MKFLLAKLGFAMLSAAFLGSFLRADMLIVFGITALLIGAITKNVLSKRNDIALIFASIALGFVLVAINLLTEVYPQKELSGETAEITGVVTEITNHSGNPVYTVKTDHIGIEGAPQRIKLKISGWEDSFAMPYDKISCKVSFAVYGEGEIYDVLTNRSQGLSVFGYVKDEIRVTGTEHSTLGYHIYRIREEISSVIYRYFIDWQAPFMDELLIGRKGELDPSITAAFRKSGLSHIIAISGTHLVVIIGLLEKLLNYRKRGKHQRTKAIILIFATLFYMFIGGMGMSVVRSGLMLILSYGSKAFLSASKPMDNLGIAIITVLIFDPFASNDIGFLMSVFSFASISIFGWRVRGFLLKPFKNPGKALKFLAETVSASFVASVAVIPVSVLTFGNMALIAPVSNIFATFFAEYMLSFGVLTVIFGMIPFCSFLAEGCAFIAMLCGGALLKIAEFFAKIPYAYVTTENESLVVWLLGSIVLVLIPFIFKKREYLKLSLSISAVTFIAFLLLHSLFYSDTVKITVKTLEKGTGISFSSEEGDFLFINGLSYSDRYELIYGRDYDGILSIGAESGYAELELLNLLEPEFAFISDEGAAARYKNASLSKPGKITVTKENYFQIIEGGAFTAKFGEFNLLYIFEECDIIDLESEYKRPDVIIFDGVSPENYPFLRAKYLVFRNMSGYYNGADEIITLKNGEITFYSYNENLTKGRCLN